MLTHLALAVAPLLSPATIPVPHTLTAPAPIEVWATGLGDLHGIAVDPEGRVWVTDHDGGRVLRLDAPGAARVVATGLAGPLGVALDAAGRALVVESHAGRVVQVEPGAPPRVVAERLDRPRWIAVADDATVYVSTRGGDVLALRDGAAPAALVRGLRRPEGLAVRDRVLYVATRGLAPGHDDPVLRVALEAEDGDPVARPLDGALRKPVAVALDAIGRVFVSAHRLVLADDQVTGVVARLDPGAGVDVFAAGGDGPQGLAFDRLGHLYLAEARAGRVLRFVAPPPPALDPLPAWTRVPSVTLSGRAEPEARVDVLGDETSTRVLAGPAGEFALPLSLALDAVNRFEARAVAHDGAGLVSAAVGVEVVHDGTAPALVVDAPPTGALVRGTVQIRATAADEGSALDALELAIAGQPLPATAVPTLPAPGASVGAAWDSTTAADGVHTVVARARDRAGNAASLTRSFTVDNTPPDSRVTGPAQGPDGPRLILGGSDDLTPAAALEFATRLDGGPWSSFSPAASMAVGELSPGVHRVEVVARDRAGNIDPTPASLVFATPAVGLRVSITEPPSGARVPTGALVVRGMLDPAFAEVGVTVNGAPAWLDGATFTARVDVDAAVTELVAVVAAPDGRTGQATIPIAVADTLAPALVASPSSGVAPLTVRLSLSRDERTVQVELDTDGDGMPDFTGPSLVDHAVVYARPGVYVARVTALDDAGARTEGATVIRVLDRAALDGLLRARWGAMRDALRRGDVAAGVEHIVGRRRADYEAAFRLLGASLPGIDGILTDLTPIAVRNAAALYEMRRTDDGVLRSFEVRFAVDADGVWRLEAF